jgi:hypothetical protein
MFEEERRGFEEEDCVPGSRDDGPVSLRSSVSQIFAFVKGWNGRLSRAAQIQSHPARAGCEYTAPLAQIDLMSEYVQK